MAMPGLHFYDRGEEMGRGGEVKYSFVRIRPGNSWCILLGAWQLWSRKFLLLYAL